MYLLTKVSVPRFIARLEGNQVAEPTGFEQPSIYDWLINSLDDPGEIQPFMTIHDVICPSKDPGATSASNPYFHSITPRTLIITEIYNLIRDPEKPYEDIVAYLVEKDITASFIESYPEGVAVPIWESIARCQDMPPSVWGESALNLVGRRDLKMLITDEGKREPLKWTTVGIYSFAHFRYSFYEASFLIFIVIYLFLGSGSRSSQRCPRRMLGRGRN